MSALQGKTDEELIQMISHNLKYSPNYLRGMKSSLPLEELAVMSQKEKQNLYRMQVPIFFGVTAVPFVLLAAGKMKPTNTTFKFLGFGLLGITFAKITMYSTLHTEARKQFPNGTLANMGKGKFLSNIIFRGKNLYGEGWVKQKELES